MASEPGRPAAARPTVEDVVRERDALRSEVKIASARLEDRAQRIAALAARVSALESDAKTFASRLQDRAQRLEAAAAEIAAFKTRAAQAMGDAAGGETSFEAMVERLEQRAARITALVQENDQLRSALKEAEARVAERAERIAALVKDQDQLRSDLKDAEARVGDRARRIDELSGELAAFRDRAVAALGAGEGDGAAIEGEDLSTLSIADFVARLEQRGARIEALVKQTDGLNSEIKELSARLEDRAAKLLEQQDEIQALRKKAGLDVSATEEGAAKAAEAVEALVSLEKPADDGAFWRRDYADYGDYLRHQVAKLPSLNLSKYEKMFLEAFGARLDALPFLKRGQSVLCLGARTGVECQAFIDRGCFAIGIDLYPGENNRFVVTGDFHALQYADQSVALVYTNTMDHAFDLARICAETARVLDRGSGRFVIEAMRGPEDADGRERGEFEAMFWRSNQQLFDAVTANGFIEEMRFPIAFPWPGDMVIFRPA